MISVSQLTKRFGAQIAVDSLTLEIPAGQIVGFLGPSGAGKSTSLRMLTGMIEPTSGSASICGFDLQRQTIEVKRHVGFVPESGAVFESLTGLVLWLAFIKLAQNYEAGLQVIAETTAKPKTRRGRSWVDRLISVPPLSWWMRDPVSRASFLLLTAYLVRDRDVKLRIYPGIAPMLIIPFVFLFQKGGIGDGFGIAFSGGYIGIIPLLGLNILKYSQQWQASDIFRMAPVLGPAGLCNGARRAVLLFLTLPMVLAIAAIIIIVQGLTLQILLLLPGILAIPVYSLVPALIGHAVPLSSPIEEGKSANRGLSMLLVTFLSIGLSLVAFLMWKHHWFWYFLSAEALLALGLYLGMRHALSRLRWSSAE